ncbi:MAG: hypothetical protein B7Y36_13765 [Novosphingobium sp. 28-62-57]|uniref:glycosyltransferase family 39 protein n=1 Tax=unclassified Novosphingobium TaxID=2644732 RepID=UPI000BDD5720|nr:MULTISPECIES: glycosyltransferase family 39 protein [unclassified Novosphingobium]OYW48950.1 MAG: hypothetical protein B7Z34_11245 [Novosphingobium sp. 12-62-10]OYZ09585.1 MAG: hypothetical protein B7Y36_13765 [Novosphingobium sp. 28-62-57]OZA34320.1 MAG: hypothetical protein B7X92_10540 [Novosphingobium sp. 17-62-9]HQS68625.1 glycosyltransferase family 39 protein [Novosphingobium sp.]
MFGAVSITKAVRRSGIDPALVLIVMLAGAVRLPIAVLTVYHHPDEIWQYIEPAYGLVTGDWIRTWDIRLGIRSWLIPLMMLPPVWLGHAIDPAGEVHLLLPRLAMGLASLGTVWAAWVLGARIGRQHAIVAAFVAATWVDFAYFAVRPSSDSLAALCIIPGLALLVRFCDAGNRRDALLGGFLLGLGFIARFPLGPALAIPFLWAGRRDFRRAWVPLLLGAAGGVLADVIANALMGQWPLLWIYHNVFANVVANRSHAYGVETADWYVRVLAWQWQFAFVLILPALAFGARRYPVLLATAIAVIAVHSAIGHKEYRFILLAVLLIVLLAAIGSVDLVQWLVRNAQIAIPQRRFALLSMLWLALSVQIGAVQPFAINWNIGRAPLMALRTVAAVPGLCGVATYRIRDVPFMSRAMLNRDVPVLLLDGQRSALRAEPRYNAVIAPIEHLGELPPAYRFAGCMSPRAPLFEQQYCVAVRKGACSGQAGVFGYNRQLIAKDL